MACLFLSIMTVCDVSTLVDDVTTSGISLKICRELLVEAGAERVAMLALGKSEG